MPYVRRHFHTFDDYDKIIIVFIDLKIFTFSRANDESFALCRFSTDQLPKTVNTYYTYRKNGPTRCKSNQIFKRLNHQIKCKMRVMHKYRHALIMRGNTCRVGTSFFSEWCRRALERSFFFISLLFLLISAFEFSNQLGGSVKCERIARSGSSSRRHKISIIT